MAGKLKHKDWEKEDRVRMELAVREIAASANLRFFFRSLLSSVGTTGTPDAGDSEQTKRLLGRHSVGTQLVEIFMEHNGELYPTLLLEDYRETMERSKESDHDID